MFNKLKNWLFGESNYAKTIPELQNFERKVEQIMANEKKPVAKKKAPVKKAPVKKTFPKKIVKKSTKNK